MKLKIGSTYQKAVTIIEKLGAKHFHFYLWKKRRRKVYCFPTILQGGCWMLGVRIVAIDHRHAVSLPVELEPYVHGQDVSKEPLKLHLLGHQIIQRMRLHISLIRLHPLWAIRWAKAVTDIPTRKGSP